jgi:hypothetical protein
MPQMRDLWLTTRDVTGDARTMALGDVRRSLITRVQSGCLAAYAATLVVVLPLMALMALGLVVRALSVAVGAPLPYVPDDPDRIEWGGLAELVGYGLAGAVTLYVFYVFAQRALPATALGHVGRVIGAAMLLVLAVSGAWVAIDEWDLRAVGLALACGYGASRVARGLPLDDGDAPESGGFTHRAN